VIIRGTTRLAAVIGSPVAHSLSPVLHNAAFAALGLDWAYVAFDVAPADLEVALRGATALGLEGLSVTMPHKESIAKLVDRLSPTASQLGAVNTVHHVGGQLVGESTDGAGFIDALRHDEGFDAQGTTAAVIGAGGAARAIVLALAQARAREIVVVNRSPERAAAAAALGGSVARVGQPTDIEGAQLVINATPLGMDGVHPDQLPIDPRLLHRGHVVVDLVYHPLRTPLLRAARERGAVSVTGLGMLIHQAAHAFRLWTGEDPPLEAMSAAAVAALSREE
jgi:shikimate dehydrogenase